MSIVTMKSTKLFVMYHGQLSTDMVSHSSQSGGHNQVPGEEEAAEGGAQAADDVKDLKAKLAKIKRQAITFKSKYNEAAAARDTALVELELIKQV